VAIETYADLRGDVREQERLIHGFLRATTSQKRVRSEKERESGLKGHLTSTCDRFASAAGTLHVQRNKIKSLSENNEKGGRRRQLVGRWGRRVRTCVHDRNRCGSNPATLRGTAPAETRPLGTSNFRDLQSRSSLPCPRGKISREKRVSSVLPSRNKRKKIKIKKDIVSSAGEMIQRIPLTQAGCRMRRSYAATYAWRTSWSEMGPAQQGIRDGKNGCVNLERWRTYQGFRI
jgi:hypothetical protein